MSLIPQGINDKPFMFVSLLSRNKFGFGWMAMAQDGGASSQRGWPTKASAIEAAKRQKFNPRYQVRYTWEHES